MGPGRRARRERRLRPGRQRRDRRHERGGDRARQHRRRARRRTGWRPPPRPLAGHPRAAAVATKLVDLADPALLYDAGDVLRRDGACEQRGRFERDTGAYDAPGEVFSACAGAALYRRSAVLAAGGFDERLGTYLEDVELGLRLRLAGWTCRWEPRAVAAHAGGGLERTGHGPGAWAGAQHPAARRAGVPAALAAATSPTARPAGRGTPPATGRCACTRPVRAAALPLLPAMLRERAALRSRAAVGIDAIVPRRPIRGPRAGGHPSRHAR